MRHKRLRLASNLNILRPKCLHFYVPHFFVLRRSILRFYTEIVINFISQTKIRKPSFLYEEILLK